VPHNACPAVGHQNGFADKLFGHVLFKQLYKFGVKLRELFYAHLKQYFERAFRAFISTLRNHRVVCIAYCHYSCIQGDFISCELIGITGAVHFFMVMTHALPYLFAEFPAAA
jgi:hypothetical protein